VAGYPGGHGLLSTHPKRIAIWRKVREYFGKYLSNPIVK
jgi:hypothetical protein